MLLNDVSNVPNNQVMHYQVTVPGFSLDFASSDEIALALYATATERVRPGEWSSPIDPNAPPSPPAPAPGWIGRGCDGAEPAAARCDFQSACHRLDCAAGRLQPGAWSAFLARGQQRNRLHGLGSHGKRAVAVVVAGFAEPRACSCIAGGSRRHAEELVQNNFAQSLQAFSRLNTNPITTTSMEVEVPGNASVLYCYMISAVSSQSVESTRTAQNSPIAVYGVPQRIVPGQPRLRLRSNDTGSTASSQWRAGDGACRINRFSCKRCDSIEHENSAWRLDRRGVRVYRCRSAALAADAGLMGPPVYLETDPRWSAYTETPLRGGQADTGMAIIDTAAAASWYPWYYRVQAIGVQDIANGFYSGKSLPSQVQSAYNLPPNPPLISPDPPVVTQGLGAVLVTFTADLPIPASPLGASLVELLKAAPRSVESGTHHLQHDRGGGAGCDHNRHARPARSAVDATAPDSSAGTPAAVSSAVPWSGAGPLRAGCAGPIHAFRSGALCSQRQEHIYRAPYRPTGPPRTALRFKPAWLGIIEGNSSRGRELTHGYIFSYAGAANLRPCRLRHRDAATGAGLGSGRLNGQLLGSGRHRHDL